MLKNQAFDLNKYEGHADVIQIRYSENSPLSKRLREIFAASWLYVERIKNLPENQNRKLTIRVPDDQQEYLALSVSNLPNVFIAECITADIKQKAISELAETSELGFETFEPRVDPGATIKEASRIQKIRQLDRSIGDSLKRLYKYRCQMTGERIGEAYGSFVVEAHHIVPFTSSLNNDTSNIIVLSPSYHRIIHKTYPTWDKTTLSFHFPNGLTEKIMLNKHL